ncbi:DUF2190 family protein [Pseudoroseicyclus sp. CXY001]|uniref:DUF2190 family protein n=1 Tax=Pseudoroseicyclus sp. CXY001 TaxID=3242492 RepID=UPI0035711F32
MKNFKAQGETLTFTAGAAYASGDGVVVGTIFGVAVNDVASGEEGVLNLLGVYELPKAASQAWTVGAAIFWDESAAEATTVAEDNRLIGVAMEARGSGAEEVLGLVRLNGIGGLGAAVAVTDEA